VLLENMLLVVPLSILDGGHSSIWTKHIPQSVSTKDQAAMTANFHCNDPNIWFWRHDKLI
jgi:hypothetical protein